MAKPKPRLSNPPPPLAFSGLVKGKVPLSIQALHPTHGQDPLVLALKLWDVYFLQPVTVLTTILSLLDSFNRPLNEQPACRSFLQLWLLHTALKVFLKCKYDYTSPLLKNLQLLFIIFRTTYKFNMGGWRVWIPLFSNLLGLISYNSLSHMLWSSSTEILTLSQKHQSLSPLDLCTCHFLFLSLPIPPILGQVSPTYFSDHGVNVSSPLGEGVSLLLLRKVLCVPSAPTLSQILQKPV